MKLEEVRMVGFTIIRMDGSLADKWSWIFYISDKAMIAPKVSELCQRYKGQLAWLFLIDESGKSEGYMKKGGGRLFCSKTGLEMIFLPDFCGCIKATLIVP